MLLAYFMNLRSYHGLHVDVDVLSRQERAQRVVLGTPRPDRRQRLHFLQKYVVNMKLFEHGGNSFCAFFIVHN